MAAINTIPEGASVSASTPLIPHLAARPVLIRFPYHVDYTDRSGGNRSVDWIAVDLDYHSRDARRVAKHRRNWEKIKTRLNAIAGDYSPQVVHDGVVVLQRGADPDPEAATAYQQLRQELP